MSTAVASVAVASAAPAAPSDSQLRKVGSVTITPRASASRGHADHGWLNTYHTFSFANYYDPRYESLHALRVINEDRVTPGDGFGRHPHREFEIFSYVVRGALKHEDSMGNLETIGRGYVQFTSAGTGIAHSEHNASEKELVHFLQCWVKPNKSGLKPSYATKHFSDASKTDQLRLLLSEDGREESIVVHQDAAVYASILNPDKSVQFDVLPDRDVYLQLVQDATGFRTEAKKTALTITSSSGTTTLKGGDGALIQVQAGLKTPQTFTLTGAGVDQAVAEFLIFDIKKD